MGFYGGGDASKPYITIASFMLDTSTRSAWLRAEKFWQFWGHAPLRGVHRGVQEFTYFFKPLGRSTETMDKKGAPLHSLAKHKGSSVRSINAAKVPSALTRASHFHAEFSSEKHKDTLSVRSRVVPGPFRSKDVFSSDKSHLTIQKKKKLETFFALNFWEEFRAGPKPGA